MKEITEGIAKKQINIWNNSSYYKDAEKWIDSQWENLIWPRIKYCDFNCVLDLAAGQGRNTKKLLKYAKELYVVDIVQSNIDVCKEKFIEKNNINYILCDGISLSGIPDNSITLVYCFDAMVHFDPEVVYMYINEIKRVLKPNGTAFLHHSNFSSDPNIYFGKNPHARNFMSKNLFLHWSLKASFGILSSDIIDWGGEKNIDCITLLRKKIT